MLRNEKPSKQQWFNDAQYEANKVQINRTSLKQEVCTAIAVVSFLMMALTTNKWAEVDWSSNYEF